VLQVESSQHIRVLLSTGEDDISLRFARQEPLTTASVHELVRSHAHSLAARCLRKE
jgi:hypothetical protein